ncbi:MAG: opacity protein-like surface antigen [Flavobacteriaceae bacterium]|jgi:opacity protein-like surface antigen
MVACGGVNYQFHKNIGVGLNYRYFDFTTKLNKTNWNGEFLLNFQGPLLIVNTNF